MTRTRPPKAFWRTLTRVHRYAGLVLGIQIVLWFLSGFVMALLPIETVRGKHMIMPTAPSAAMLDVDLNAIAAVHGEPFQELRVEEIGGRLIANVDGKAFYDADGAPLTPLETPAIRSAALAAYAGEAPLSTLRRLDKAPLDYRGPTPVWQARFDDSARTRLYLDPLTGKTLRVRTRMWRVFDTMWGLHIMDWTERTRFNTWWLRLASGAALLFALSGMALVVQRIFLRPKRRRPAVA